MKGHIRDFPASPPVPGINISLSIHQLILPLQPVDDRLQNEMAEMAVSTLSEAARKKGIRRCPASPDWVTPLAVGTACVHDLVRLCSIAVHCRFSNFCISEMGFVAMLDPPATAISADSAWLFIAISVKISSHSDIDLSI